MPPRISSNRGDPRGGHPSRGGHRVGANRGSQPGGPSSASENPATPQISTPTATSLTQVNPPSTPRGQPSGNRGRGRGRGISHRGTPGATPSSPVPSSLIPTQIPTAIAASATQVDTPITSGSQPSGNRGRGRGRGTSRGSTPGAAPPSSPVPSILTPTQIPTTTTVSTNQVNPPEHPSANRGRGRGRGRGTSRGGTPGASPSIPVPSSPVISLPISASDSESITSPSQSGGQSFRARGGRGGHRGSMRGFHDPTDSPSPFRGGRPSRGRGVSGASTAGGPPPAITDPQSTGGTPYIPDHIKTFGAKRPGFGTGGRAVKITINAFPTTIPDVTIYQYDVIQNDKLPARFNMELMRSLQEENTTIFTPKVVFDGRKIMFSVHELPLGPTHSQQFSVSRPRPNGRPPKVYTIILTKVTMINSELLRRYVARELSHEENVSTTLAALNVAVKMQPNQIHPFNKRSFYIPNGKVDIGGGIELWRGIFQSVRPTIGRLIVNIDLSTGMMYKEGSLLNLCIDFFGRPPGTSPNSILVPPRSLREIERVKLQKFLSGVRVEVTTSGTRERVVRGLSRQGADTLTFETRPGVQMTVAQYFQSLGVTLQYPSVICALVGQVAMVPLELCTVPRGQFMRKEIPDDKVRRVLEFSTKKPHERLESIKGGLQHLQYGQSEYVRSFGMTIDENPLSTNARVIEAPILKYNSASLQPSIKPKDGAWNMIDKKFYKPSKVVRWAVIIYDSERNFPQQTFVAMVKGFSDACAEVGIMMENIDPIYKFENGQGPIHTHLTNAVKECQRQFNEKPSLLVVILPDNAGDIYNAVKHFGDITFGIPTQCLKSFNLRKAKSQYWNNVMLKVNVKLGGINVIPDPSSLAARALTDPANPTIVMGADVMHPPPGVNRPSYSAIIGSIDSYTAKYVATSRAQTGKREIINDMKEMCKAILHEYKEYQVNVEKKKFDLSRLIFYRDGVSESQFQQVLELELPMIKEACEEFGVNPKITLIIVGKRHHIQFFPMNREGDRSGNCFAGTVVDRDVTHPTDHDFYLLSHAGILGTSRPAHYSVLYDDYGFNADTLQSLSYSLCHLYARSTRSVSVPAPVYYADLVCSRAKTHFDPKEHLKFDTSTNLSGSTNLEDYKEGYKPLHGNQRRAMYFA